MLVFGYNNVILYKVFLGKLKKAAHEWYHQLPTGCITNFEELAKAFKDHFITSQLSKNKTPSLVLIG